MPFLEVALKGSQKEQFWLAYVEALIQGKQLKAAVDMFYKAKKQGFKGQEMKNLEAKVHQIETMMGENNIIPPEE